ncbi:VanZ family protein [Paenibacillus sp. NPDC058071]|uniref:VanZ family protein n=1 Tax=Paenibacillus sp. NPDC058071 TaxID=3346326 RepID=UPI0036DAD5D2
MGYLFDFMLLVLVYFLFFYRKWNRISKQKLAVNTLLYVYIAMVLFVTLMPFTIPFAGTNNFFWETANFEPFRDLRLNHGGAAKEIFLNVIMMMPFGFLFPLTTKKGFSSTVASTFLFSLMIECAQLLSAWWGDLHSRTFDVTDLITNTTGALTDFLLFVVLRPVVSKIIKI